MIEPKMDRAVAQEALGAGRAAWLQMAWTKSEGREGSRTVQLKIDGLGEVGTLDHLVNQGVGVLGHLMDQLNCELERVLEHARRYDSGHITTP